MEIIEKYWAQIALFMTLLVGAIMSYYAYRTKIKEIEFSKISDLRFSMAQKYIHSYTTIYKKLGKVSNQLFLGSWKKKDLLPILEEYNVASTEFYLNSQLVKFAFNKDTEEMINNLVVLFRNSTNEFKNYIDKRNSGPSGNIEYDKEISTKYKEIISQMIPNDIPELSKKIIELMGKQLKLK